MARDRQPTHGEPVRTVLHRPAVQVHQDDSLRTAAQTLTEESVGVAIVKDTHPPAVVSERDVVRALADGADADQERVADVMTEDVAWVGPEKDLLSVATLMLDNEIRHLPVVEDDVVIGVASARDVLAVLVDDTHEAAKQ